MCFCVGATSLAASGRCSSASGWPAGWVPTAGFEGGPPLWLFPLAKGTRPWLNGQRNVYLIAAAVLGPHCCATLPDLVTSSAANLLA
jgi:hypothetical protein